MNEYKKIVKEGITPQKIYEFMKKNLNEKNVNVINDLFTNGLENVKNSKVTRSIAREVYTMYFIDNRNLVYDLIHGDIDVKKNKIFIEKLKNELFLIKRLKPFGRNLIAFQNLGRCIDLLCRKSKNV